MDFGKFMFLLIVIPLLFFLILSIVVLIVINLPAWGEIPNYYPNYYPSYYPSYYDDVINNQKITNWSVGDNIQEGDYFVYKICNEDTIHQIIYPYHCYEISLEFVKLLESHTGDTWVVQSYFTVGNTIDYTIGGTIGDTIVNSNSTSPLILLIDPYTFHITTDPFNKKIGESIQNTIFSLSQYKEKSLSIGTVWDEIDSYYTNKIPLEIKNKQTIQIPNSNYPSNYPSNYNTLEVSVLSYDIVIPSNTYLHNDFPFPLKSKMYSPNVIYPEPQELYYFELLVFGKSPTLKEDFPIP